VTAAGGPRAAAPSAGACRRVPAGLDLQRQPVQPDRPPPWPRSRRAPSEQHGKLVTAQPGDQVAGADAVREPAGHGPQQLIADVMPERVVDLLEPVEVEQEEPGPATGSRRFGQRASGLAQQQRAVGQPGQLIVVRLVLSLHRSRGARVDGGHRQQEQQDEQDRPAHHDRDQRRRRQQDQVDECLVGQGGPERRRDRGARVQRHRHVHQSGVDRE